MKVKIPKSKKLDVNMSNDGVDVAFPNTVRTPVIYDKNYLHIQSVASAEWTINHNLDKFPSVTVIDSAENEVVGDVEYIDENNLIIRFLGAFSGKATLN